MPQLENGYTRIADEILEKMAKTKLNGTQYRILMIVWRSTYGWQKKEFELSESYLAKATEIHKQQIKRELKSLIEREIIIVKKEATFTTGRILAFNKNFISTQVAKKIPPIELDTTTGSELVTPTGSVLDTQNKESNKHTNKQWQEVVSFYKINCKSLPQAQKITDARKKSINARIKDYGFDDVVKALESAEASKFLTKSSDKKWLKFDWIFNPNNFVKILEGDYNNKDDKKIANGIIAPPRPTGGRVKEFD